MMLNGLVGFPGIGIISVSYVVPLIGFCQGDHDFRMHTGVVITCKSFFIHFIWFLGKDKGIFSPQKMSGHKMPEHLFYIHCNGLVDRPIKTAHHIWSTTHLPVSRPFLPLWFPIPWYSW